MKLPLLLPGWMLAAGLLAGQTAPVTVAPSSGAVPTQAVSSMPSQPTPSPTGGSNKISFHFAVGPKNAESAILTLLHSPTMSDNAGRYSGVTNVNKLSVMPPMAQFELYRNSVMNGAGFEAAIANGYFYAILQDGQQVISAKLLQAGNKPVNKNNISLAFTTTTVDQNSENITNALAQLSKLLSDKIGSYEARVMLISPGPPVGSAGPEPVIWLKSDNGGDDLVYAVNNIHKRLPGIQAGITYTANNFLDILYPDRKKSP